MSSLGTDDSVWIGWPGISADELTPADKKIIRKELEKLGCYPIFLSQQQIENFYDGYANATLWPLFHYFQSLTEHQDEFWQSYVKVNQLYHAAVQKYASDDAQIWIHDYHLMLLPGMVRAELPEASIGFFLHIPFPSYEIFRLLPNRKQIIEGLLGADLVGFHTYDYARHFLSAVLRTLGYDNKLSSVIVGDRLVRADVFPIGIDYQKFALASKSPEVKTEIEALKTSFADKRLVLSVDRLDYSKGILQRIEAFGAFLEKNKRWHKRIILVVVAVPSRIAVGPYKHMREELERAVSRVNGRYATVDWTPISYQFKSLPFNQLLALYARADIALITPIRDGMNLVAKEYIAAKQGKSGVLILSEMAGAAEEMPEATRVNPNDEAGLVTAIEAALKLPATEQRRRLSVMQHRLARYNVNRWAQDFIEQLSHAKERRSEHDLSLITPAVVAKMLTKYHKASKRLLLFDYDGTLTNFVSDFRPRSSQPSNRLMRILKKLSSTPGTDVMIVSGRPRKALESWFSKLPIGLAAEHGAWVRDQGKWVARTDVPSDWKIPFRKVLESITERTPGALIEDKNFSLVWHYRNVSPELAYVRRATLKHDVEMLLRDSDIEMFQGSKIIEFKPKFITKGAVVEQKMAEGGYDFFLAIGDDYTDEDMFRALPVGAYTIKVGLTASTAKYHLSTVEEALQLISILASLPEK